MDDPADPDHVLERAIPRELRARPVTWDDLAVANNSTIKIAVWIYWQLGLAPVLDNGILEEGGCTCRRPGCESPGKHPMWRGWQMPGFDLGQVDDTLERERRCNVALRTGEQPDGSHLVAIDVDGPLALLDPLVKQLGPMPDTLTARSGGGGWHFLFRVPAGRKIKNRDRIVPGVDVKGDRGKLTVAPSRHASGNRYRWINICQPAMLGPAAADVDG